jgi:hypothetical protein
MRFTEGMFTRTENGTSTWGGGVLKSFALPALPPSRRERSIREQAGRAAVFATRVVGPGLESSLLPSINRGKS